MPADIRLKDYIFKEPRQTKLEKKRRQYVAWRHFQMDTHYRQSLLEMAALGREATDGIVTDEDRVVNSDLLKVPISHAVILQRLSTLIDNPSKAIYRGETKNKKKLEVTRQLNIHDKRRGKYSASYQNFQARAEKEGLCVVMQGWHEEFRQIGGKRVTVGHFFSEQTDVMLENFWWDPVANELRGETGLVANDTILREYISIDDVRRTYGNNPDYKNISKVKPFADSYEFYGDWIWNPEWAEKTIKTDNEVNEVVHWRYYCRNFWDEEIGQYTDVLLEYMNGVEVRKTKLPVPKIKGKATLPFFKLVSFPTGGFGGLSIPAIIRHPERALQRMITMADTQAELAVSPIQFMSSSIMDTLDDEDLFPGTRIGVSMTGRTVADEIYTMDVKDITNGAQWIVEKMLELITLVSGVDIRAFFESPKQKAVSTERKREIQERLLRYSVIYNESHGFTDMEELRFHIMLQNYPVLRNMYQVKDNEVETSVERFPSIPINGFQANVVEGDENKAKAKQQFEIRKAPKSFSFLTITPQSLIESYNVDIYIEGAELASNEDIFKLDKNIDKINALVANPWVATIIDPKKAGRQVYKALNLDENEWIREDLEVSDNTKHGAEKEIQALLISDVVTVDIQLDDDYDAKEYEEIFSNFIATPVFEKLSGTVQQQVMERYNFHVQNAVNPYYKEQMREEKAKLEEQRLLEEQEIAEGGVGSPEANKPLKSAPKSEGQLTKKVNIKAGKLGKAGKAKNTNSREQK